MRPLYRIWLKALPGFICSVLLAASLHAQKLSYLYIQGDKKVPIYVKLDGEMQPRLGKNYVVVSQLAPGPTNISVAFQQNVFPEQSFTVLIPEGGSRNFLVAQKDGGFALYDLQQHFYLKANNEETDDRLPTTGSTSNSTASGSAPPDLAILSPDTAAGQAHRAAADIAAAKAPENTGPDFMEGVVLRQDTAAQTMADAAGVQMPAPQPGALINSDCPAAMSTADFSGLYKSVLDANGDEERLNVMLKETERCYSTIQVRSITALLQLDAARLSYLRRIFSRVADQAQFPLLDDLLREPSWKSEFETLIAPLRKK